MKYLGDKLYRFIVQFEVEVESKWNQKIQGVFAEMIITDLNEDRIDSFKSASVDIGPLARAMLTPYWDTEGVEKGTYNADLIIHYAGKTTEKTLKAYVEIDSIRTEIIGVTAKAVFGRDEEGFDIITPLVAVLIMINVGWFFYFKKRK